MGSSFSQWFASRAEHQIGAVIGEERERTALLSTYAYLLPKRTLYLNHETLLEHGHLKNPENEKKALDVSLIKVLDPQINQISRYKSERERQIDILQKKEKPSLRTVILDGADFCKMTTIYRLIRLTRTAMKPTIQVGKDDQILVVLGVTESGLEKIAKDERLGQYLEHIFNLAEQEKSVLELIAEIA